MTPHQLSRWRWGRDGLWDLATPVCPDDTVPDLDEARRPRSERRLRPRGPAVAVRLEVVPVRRGAA